MQPPLTAEELAKLYPHLTVEQRLEMEEWHRGWIHNIMIGQATDEDYEAAMPPYPEEVRSRKPRKCPNCGFSPVGTILYGFPTFSPALKAEIEAGKTVLGGCDMSLLNPEWECSKCKQKIWKTGWNAEGWY